MRGLLVGAALVAASTMIAGSAGPSEQSAGSGGRAAVVLDNERVRIFKTIGTSRAGVEHRAGVVIPLEDGPTSKAGAAYWAADAAGAADGDPSTGSLVIVEPKDVGAAGPPPASAGSKPGDAPFTGMSFTPLFDNEKVAVIRARMEVDAREGLHTHRSDTIVVHLSGGAIEDTANGTTRVNRWKRGDVELEARGSSHAARNVGPAIDVVLVALKP
jgi:quercetin dioxygenase-like cupin family protein